MDNYRCPVTINDGGEIVYRINAPMGEAEYRAAKVYQKIHCEKRVIKALTAAIITAALFIFGYILPALIGVLSVIIIIAPMLVLKPAAARYIKNDLLRDEFRIFTFYDEHFTVETQNRAEYMEYSKLDYTAENKNYIIFGTTEMTPYVIGKNNTDIYKLLKERTC
ncbi:MAG: hypothetical protein ACI4JF_03615 [Oscillospiraceae bacterium]